MALPTTPTIRRIQSHDVTVTPMSAGSGSNSAYSQNTHQSHYAPYLREDLSQVLSLPFDKMVEILFKASGTGKQWREKHALVSSSKPVLNAHKKFLVLPQSERSRYAPFASHANNILDLLGHTHIRFCRNDAKHIAGSYSMRKPDVVVVPADLFNNGLTVASCATRGPPVPFGGTKFWYSTSLLLRLRSGKRATPNLQNLGSAVQKLDATAKDLQCASYALEMSVNSRFSDFALGIFTKGTETRLIYYDSSAIIESEAISIRDLNNLIQLLDIVAISGFGMNHSLLSAVHPVPSTTLAPPRQPLKTISADLTLKLNVAEAEVIENPGQLNINGSCVVKIYRPAQTRMSEVELIRKATTFAQKKVDMLRHLPSIFASEIRPPASVHQVLHNHFQASYELRHIEIIAMDHLLPIDGGALGAADLQTVFRDIFYCYRWLYETVGIQHRDISVGNIMYRNLDSRVCGVLNDFDHALDISKNPSGPSSNHRTGTTPYMAIGILERKVGPHYYRYDLESLYYVMVTVVSPEASSVKQWHEFGGNNLAQAKRGHLYSPTVMPVPVFSPFLEWLKEFRRIFARGYLDQSAAQDAGSETFDDETLDGSITFDTVQLILGSYL
ncbi:hypothetical protein BKA62DRAFT_764523 [Auriculariales sp. MPI-PUGE-AT-0066]|nr:hypothetical protein BKA62DRAFT_764523 [Auriculariales sp. MPI-PUGE-AT-0066]